MAFRAVIDPDLIAVLDGKAPESAVPSTMKPVTDPTILAQLEPVVQPEQPGLGERLLIGAGRGFVDVGEGAKQLALEGGQALGLLAPGTAEDFTRKAEAERQFFEQTPVGQSTSGKVGRFAGNVLPFMAIPGSQASIPARIATEAGIGGAIGGTQFVPEGQSRAENILTGGATGAGVAGTLGLLGKGIQAGRGALSRTTADEVVELGARHNVPVLAGDVGSPNVSRLSVLLEDLPGSGVKKARLNQSRLAQKAAQRQLDKEAASVALTEFGGKTGLTRLNAVASSNSPRAKSAQLLLDQIDQAGDDWDSIIQVSGNLKAFRAKLIADAKYDRVARLAEGKGTVAQSRTQQALDDAIAQAEKSALPSKGVLRTLRTLKQNLDNELSFTELREARSAVGSEISDFYKGKNAIIGERGAGYLQSVKNAIQDDLDTFTRTHGTELKIAARNADNFYRENVTPFRNAQLAKALKNADPDSIFPTFINQARDAKGRGERLYNALDSKGRAAVRAGLVRQAFNKAFDADEQIFSPAKYSGEIKRFQKSVNTFFQGNDKAELEGFSKLMRHVQRAGQVAENPPTGQRAAQLLTLGAQVGAAVQSPLSATGVISGTLATRVLFSTEKGRRILLGAAKSEPGSRTMQGFIRQANNLITRASATGAVQ